MARIDHLGRKNGAKRSVTRRKGIAWARESIHAQRRGTGLFRNMKQALAFALGWGEYMREMDLLSRLPIADTLDLMIEGSVRWVAKAVLILFSPNVLKPLLGDFDCVEH